MATVTLAITSPGEGERLWKHVLFGTSTCVAMVEGYAALDMPGNPKEALVALRDRIQKVLLKYEEPHADNTSGSTPEPLPSGDEPASETLARGISDGS
jgi:molybdopterin biosynthesis enzyme